MTIALIPALATSFAEAALRNIADPDFMEALCELYESGDVDLDHFILFLPTAFRKTPGIFEARVVDHYVNRQSLLLCVIEYS